jgi:hypothetical protein
MENKLIEDELNYEEINKIKGLKYKLKYSDTKISEDTIIKKWLSSEKLSKGDNGIVCYCLKCNLFFYFENENELNDTKKKCCDSYSYGYICNFCGKIFFDNSFCCIKTGFKISYEENLFNIEFNDIRQYIIFFPIITYIIFLFNLFGALFYFRRTKIDNDDFSSYDQRNSKLWYFGQVLVGFSLILYSLIYAIPFLILYIVILIKIIKNKFSKDKKQL